MNDRGDDPRALDCQPRVAEVDTDGAPERRVAAPGPSHQMTRDRHAAELARIIECDIVPRLMLAHRTLEERSDPVQGGVEARLAADEVAEFGRLLLERDIHVVSAYVESLRARGVTADNLLLGLVAPTARWLGMLWEEDLCDFTQVTVGLGRLQQVLRQLSPPVDPPADLREYGKRALLVAAPGEQHTLGILMVADFFRRAGWDVVGGPQAANADLAGLVRGNWYAVVGLSLACERHLEALAASIRSIRRASRNAAIGILVGGPLFTAKPQLVAEVGADDTGVDGRQAAERADHLYSLTLSSRQR